MIFVREVVIGGVMLGSNTFIIRNPDFDYKSRYFDVAGLVRAAQSEFPALQDTDINVRVFSEGKADRVLGIEFERAVAVRIPSSYTRIGELPSVYNISDNTAGDIVKQKSAIPMSLSLSPTHHLSAHFMPAIYNYAALKALVRELRRDVASAAEKDFAIEDTDISVKLYSPDFDSDYRYLAIETRVSESTGFNLSVYQYKTLATSFN